jgi:hypothetical protein
LPSRPISAWAIGTSRRAKAWIESFDLGLGQAAHADHLGGQLVQFILVGSDDVVRSWRPQPIRPVM